MSIKKVVRVAGDVMLYTVALLMFALVYGPSLYMMFGRGW